MPQLLRRSVAQSNRPLAAWIIGRVGMARSAGVAGGGGGFAPQVRVLSGDARLPRAMGMSPAPTTRRSAFLRGFSLHANVFIHQNDRPALARLCRYALRPPFALERMSEAPSGDIA